MYYCVKKVIQSNSVANSHTCKGDYVFKPNIILTILVLPVELDLTNHFFVRQSLGSWGKGF